MSSSPAEKRPLPSILAGPLLRRQEAGRLVLWLVGSRPLKLILRLRHGVENAADDFNDHSLTDQQCQIVAVGRHAFIHLIDLQLEAERPWTPGSITTCW
ncbi:Uncharacterized protein ALO64_01372 [Pseudomonas meliae]|uniref:Uncharacterized protein n=1 Tax=Pseudomonas meliae TaxID=86176 RepID=A0A0P9W1X7_9PSED|nr:Uncharacterized protein ALO64_01372 [Pseudomonas meliae]